MRTTSTLLASFIILAMHAQPAGGNLSFDGADFLHLDSIYPAGCWQVGHPNKPVFTSAYSEPNALVTDTLSPHMDSTTCYAQFTMVAEFPDVLGKSISFKYWSDMDSLLSFGWIEKQNSYTHAWNRLPISDAYLIWFEEAGELLTDSGAVFTGRTFGWHDARLHIECLGVLMEENMDRGGGWSDTMRLRFAFRGATNTEGRDGWMIDNVDVTPIQCTGGTVEQFRSALVAFPDPADDQVTLRYTDEGGTGALVDILRADGTLVKRERWAASKTMTLPTSSLPSGIYAVIVRSGSSNSTARIVIEH